MAPHDHDHVHLDESHWARWADHAELEGGLLLDFVTGAAARVAGLLDPVRRILDLGSGPGVGTAELARCFPDAQVVAVDASPAMLDRVAGRAERLGVGDRVSTHAAELPGGISELGPADVVWASMSLHHVGDEVAALRAMGAVLAPAGVLALAEFADDPMRVLPEALGVGSPGLVDRLDAANRSWFAALRAGLQDATAADGGAGHGSGGSPSPDLATMIAAAGLEVVTDEVATVRLDPPLTADGRRFAVSHLERSRGQLADRLDADDLAAVDVLLDPDDPRSLQQRDDLAVVATRRIVVARRPT